MLIVLPPKTRCLRLGPFTDAELRKERRKWEKEGWLALPQYDPHDDPPQSWKGIKW